MLASALPPPVRGDFLQIVADKIAAYPIEARGVGLLHRIAAAAQREFVSAPVAVGIGGKHGRSQTTRLERLRRS